MRKMTRLAEKLAKLRLRKKKAKATADAIDTQIEETQERMIQDMLNNNLQSFNLVGVGTIFLSKSDYPSIEDVSVFYKYLRDTKQGDIIKETVHSQTLRGWWNGQEEKPVAAAIGLGVYSKMQVSIRK